MKRTVAFGLVGVLLVSASGCAGPDALMKELLVNLNICAELIEKKESKDKLQAAIERTRATAEKIDKLKLAPDQRDALLSKYEAELKKVTQRIDEAQKARKLEGGADDLPTIAVDGFIKK